MKYTFRENICYTGLCAQSQQFSKKLKIRAMGHWSDYDKTAQMIEIFTSWSILGHHLGTNQNILIHKH